MRSTMIALILCACIPACGGTVAGETSSPPAGAGAGGEGGGQPAIGTGGEAGGGGGATPETGTSTSASTSSGAATGGSGWVQPPCVFGVEGDVGAWVGANSEGWMWGPYDGGGTLACMGTVLGDGHQFSATIGPIHGPGTYTPTDAQYMWTPCHGAAPDCDTPEWFTPASSGFQCVVELTVAPDDPAVGDPVAGTFHCGDLVDGTRSASVYGGTFSMNFLPVPD